ncbi:GAF domain-containing protein [Chroococcidiopsis sp. CCNUC1]|uniref:GAF domain-containing protein n=1 Tax=Chroococcidiopsis sp. CCNUC1 TaxID=2653189 RepID=UPI0020207395|nr:GAF domain-containing protein [Chroococcidiopsis sp. CCNUC1]URD47835.1 GAF domain-containing protein [Chroococcidiopsis sp. CCNUC1]
MVLWADYDSLPISYKGWNVAVGEKYIGNRQQLATAFTKLLAWLREYMSVDTATLLLPDEDRENLVVYATLGLEEEITQKIRIPIGQGIAGRIAASCKPMVTHNLLAEEIVSPILRQKGLRSLVGVPLPMREGMVGVLHVGSLQQRQFTERDIQQLQVVVHRLKSIMVTAQFNYLSCSASQTDIHKYVERIISLKYPHKVQNLSSALQQPLNSYWSIAVCKCLDIFRCQYILTCN